MEGQELFGEVVEIVLVFPWGVTPAAGESILLHQKRALERSDGREGPACSVGSLIPDGGMYLNETPFGNEEVAAVVVIDHRRQQLVVACSGLHLEVLGVR